METVIALLLIVGSTAVHQIEGIAIKKYNAKHEVGGFIFTALISLFAMLFFFLTDRGGLHFPIEMLPYGILANVCYCSASYLTFVALSSGSFVMTNLFLSYGLLFSIGYGLFFLQEPATFLTYVGLALIIISIFLVRKDSTEEKGTVKISAKWVIATLFSVISSGVLSVLMKMQQVKFDQVDNEFMIVTLGFSAITLLLIGLIKDGRNLGYILKNGGLYATAAGLSNGATNLLSLFVTRMIPVSIASPSRAGVKILFSFLLALFMFKEKFSKRQIIGVILGTAALVLLNINI